MDIKYTIVDDYDHIIDEKGNSFIALRKIIWGDSEDDVDQSKVKLDLRKWHTDSNGEEKVGKGWSFLTEQGPHNLAKILVENGFGKTKDILNGIKDREDFRPALNSILGKDDEFYDPNCEEEVLYLPTDELFNYGE